MYTVYIIELNRKIFPRQVDAKHLFRLDDFTLLPIFSRAYLSNILGIDRLIFLPQQYFQIS